jgi:hypothetical protein
MSTILQLLVTEILGWPIRALGRMWLRLINLGVDNISKDYRDDPVYTKNVRELIERNKRFEKKE